MMDRLSAVGDPGLRSALAFVRGAERAVTADELAGHDGIHRNVARSRLERLAGAGLLEVSFSRGRGGPGAGRPAKTYRAAPELATIEFPAHRYEDLVGLLAEGRTDLHDVGAAFGRRLARAAELPRSRSLDDVCAGLRRLGFQAAREDDAIVTPTCPLRPLVAAHPELAALDEGMWSALVGRSASCTVEGCLDPSSPCRIQVLIESRR
jgi:predicted ArsR family transcriptional regulator